MATWGFLNDSNQSLDTQGPGAVRSDLTLLPSPSRLTEKVLHKHSHDRALELRRWVGNCCNENMYRTGSFVINFSDGSKQVNQEECFQTTQVVQILNDLVSNEESRAKPQNYRLSHSSLDSWFRPKLIPTDWVHLSAERNYRILHTKMYIINFSEILCL